MARAMDSKSKGAVQFGALAGTLRCILVHGAKLRSGKGEDRKFHLIERGEEILLVASC